MFALRAARVFDGDRLVDRPVVLVDDRRIVAAGAEPPADIEVVDLGADTTLLPGLVDTHQHLCFDGHGTLENQVVPFDDETLAARARSMARRAVLGGVTTVRDLGDRGWVTLGLRHDPTLPTIVAAGPPITRSDGHCWYLGGGYEADELGRAVAERVDRGVDVIKVMMTGGVLTPDGRYPVWTTQFTTADLRRIVDDGHAAGLPVTAHCHGHAGIEAAIDARVDSIEHCSFLGSDGRVSADDAMLERLAASGVVVSATIGRLPDFPMLPMLAANLEALDGVRARLHQLGATIVAGTDAGINAGKPHDVLPYALAEFVAAGQRPLDGLRAMTTVAAGVCGMGERKGRLAAGYDADILAVHGDPTADATALTAVVGVWRDGAKITG